MYCRHTDIKTEKQQQKKSILVYLVVNLNAVTLGDGLVETLCLARRQQKSKTHRLTGARSQTERRAARKQACQRAELRSSCAQHLQHAAPKSMYPAKKVCRVSVYCVARIRRPAVASRFSCSCGLERSHPWRFHDEWKLRLQSSTACGQVRQAAWAAGAAAAPRGSFIGQVVVQVSRKSAVKPLQLSFSLTYFLFIRDWAIFVAAVFVFHSFTMTSVAVSVGMLKGELWVKKDERQASTLLWRRPRVKSTQSVSIHGFWGISPTLHSSKTNHIKYKSSHVQSLHRIPFFSYICWGKLLMGKHQISVS